MKIITRNGLKALANDDGKIISPWLKGFVEGVGLLANPPQSNYFIGIDTKGKQAIYDQDGNQISDEFDYISPEGLVSGQSQYYIGRKSKFGLSYERIYDKNRNPVGPKFNKILPDGLVTGTRDYYIGEKKISGKTSFALMDKNGVNVFGRDVKSIDANDFLRGKSNTFIFNAKGFLSSSQSERVFVIEYKPDDHQHPFSIKEEKLLYSQQPNISKTTAKSPLTDGVRSTLKGLVASFLDNVKSLKSSISFTNVFNAYERAAKMYLYKLVGKTPPKLEADQKYYSIVRTKDGKVMLADKNGEIVSRAFNDITGGPINGKSPYYIATRGDGKQAIFDVRTGKQVSGWHRSINPSGLVNGESLFYIAERNDGKKAIFCVDNPKQPISDWHSFIGIAGLVGGSSPYYMYGEYSKIEDRILYNIKDITGKKLLDKNYRNIEALDFLLGNSNTVEVDTTRMNIMDIITGNMKHDVNMKAVDLSDKVDQDISWQPSL